MSGQKKTTKVGEKKRPGRKAQNNCTICGNTKDVVNSGGYFRSYCKRCCALVSRINNIVKNKGRCIGLYKENLRYFKIYIKVFTKGNSLSDLMKEHTLSELIKERIPRKFKNDPNSFQCRHCGVKLYKSQPHSRGRNPNICSKCQAVQSMFIRKMKNTNLTKEACKEKIKYYEKNIKFAEFVLDKKHQRDLKEIVKYGIKLGVGE